MNTENRKFFGVSFCFRNILSQNTGFESISDFKWCMRCGGEVLFVWNGIMYCAFGSVQRNGKRMILISRAYPTDGAVDKEEIKRTEKWCDNADEVLEYMVGEDRLRDVITQVEVYERTI